MLKRVSVVVLTANLLFGCGQLNAQTVSSDTPSAYQEIVKIDFKVGDTWTYRNVQQNGVVNRTWTESVVAVDGNVVTIQRVDRLEPDGRELAPTIKVLKMGEGIYALPLSIGKQWQSSETLENGNLETIDYRVVGFETINTPHGAVDAFNILSDFSINGKRYSQAMWFAPAVKHVVRLIYVKGSESKQRTELVDWHIL